MELNTGMDLGVSVGTLLLAGCTALLAKRTKEAVEESSRSREVWESMAADATRARLDAAAPAVNVFVRETPDVIYGVSQGAATYDSEWPADRPWIIPRDRDVKVAIKCFVTIENNSRASVEITCRGAFWFPRERGSDSFVLRPGEEKTVQLVAIHTIAEWLENYACRRRKGSSWSARNLLHAATGSIVMSDRNDNGVSDTWELSLTGRPIELNELNAGEARQARTPVPARPQLVIPDISDRHRMYFISRSTGTTLPVVRSTEKSDIPLSPIPDTAKRYLRRQWSPGAIGRSDTNF
ncbi:hypothetical protein ACFWAN_32520 [Streptomyces mirabilis]|uniref:hypothetical protein n=1 Tax=Streptomyces mirabilis TaxID=68239 RepID=UPI003653BA39